MDPFYDLAYPRKFVIDVMNIFSWQRITISHYLQKKIAYTHCPSTSIHSPSLCSSIRDCSSIRLCNSARAMLMFAK